jgi:hypothetical protein
MIIDFVAISDICGLQIYENDVTFVGESKYIRVLCHADSLVISNKHLQRSRSQSDKRCLVEISEHAHIGRLHISSVKRNGGLL